MKNRIIALSALMAAVTAGLAAFVTSNEAQPAFGTICSNGQRDAFGQLMTGAMASMHQCMEEAQQTGDPDLDFARLMIPHHEGAIAMAKAELLYGRDPALKRLAQGIVVEQDQEIRVMRLSLGASQGGSAR